LKLCEHPDFDQLIVRTAQHFASQGFREEFIEKDYYAMDVLRAVASHAFDRVIFKGGTSLSKAWGLIDRFSEDIDLFLDTALLGDNPTRGQKDRALKGIRDAVETATGMTAEGKFSRAGFRRSGYFTYTPKFAVSMQPKILLEISTASGREPKETVALRSYVSQFLLDQKINLGAEDDGAFDVQVLHFRRTFVEKLFAIHGYVHRQITEQRPIGSYARHYYDLHQLALRDEVKLMLSSTEYSEIKADYDRICSESYPDIYVRPNNLSFRDSPALFPEAALEGNLKAEYESQCKALCFKGFPSWDAVRTAFDAMRVQL
jgi:hypothetical protein